MLLCSFVCAEAIGKSLILVGGIPDIGVARLFSPE